MNIQYQIMELDTEYLKKYVGMSGTRDRVCFIPAKLHNFESNTQDSFEDAVRVIQSSGNDYMEYTIIPRIYMTDY